jgi:hypothetical protein
MIDERALAAEKLLALYLSLPQTPSRLSRQDRKLARQLIERKTPPEMIEAAILLAIARRSFRDPSLPPLGPIRSFHYFLPVIDEVLSTGVSSDYVHYLKQKLAPVLETAAKSE